jgi:hypothetical protein
MLNDPDAADLLAIARETLLKSVLPSVPEDKRYPVLMIANAMAVAGRETTQRQPLYVAELAELEAFYGSENIAGAAREPEQRLLALNRRLARDARNGRFEGKDALQFRALLERQVQARLRVSSPKYPASPC